MIPAEMPHRVFKIHGNLHRLQINGQVLILRHRAVSLFAYNKFHADRGTNPPVPPLK